ncbi:MAG: methylmalonyl-CoA mutase [bacterium]|nr:MAG: methylmalonyl-CoA mutase [bacterium]
MSDENLVFAGVFPTPSHQEWRAVVDKALKGAPFEKKMVTRTYEGITITPLYTREDWSAAGDPSGIPGASPFTRGFSASGAGVNGWCIRQEQTAPDPKAANAAILTDLEHGATSLSVRLDRCARAGLDPDQAPADSVGEDGVAAYSLADFETLLDTVLLDVAPVALTSGGQFLPAAALLAALWRKRGVADAKVRGAFNADPLGTLAATGSLPVSLETALTHMAELAAHTARTWPQVTAVGIDTTPYYDAGATETQDLACAMATGVAYLRAMTAAGMTVDDACRQIAFTFPVGCDFFMSMAKVRAARTLWSRIAAACGASVQAARIHARTAERMITRRDPWVNMLRTTTAAFAAGIAGANSITVLPFDCALEEPDDFSRRIARNSQVILREESSLTKVIDPAGGSWYIESLTDQLARAAWGLFQEIEKAGGMAEVLRNGTLAGQIAAVWTAREKAIATRRDPITGVSEFPNLTETVPAHAGPDRKALAERARAALPPLRTKAAAPLKNAKPGTLMETAIAAAQGATLGSMAAALMLTPATTITALPKHHLAESFEALRDAAEAHKTMTGAWPAIFLANLGPIAAHTGRATYAKNFFETGGVQALANNGFTDAEACASAFKESGARIAILCSSDALYETYVATVAPVLKAAGCAFLFLAGSPGDKKESYMGAGVDDFIFMGCDVLGTLRATLSRLGVTC